MNIQERLAEVRKALGSDSDKVAHLLTDIEKSFIGVHGELERTSREVSAVNKESAERRIALREKDDLLAEREAMIEKLSNNEELKTYKSEVERLRQLENSVNAERKESLTSELRGLAKHSDFENFSKIMKFPEKDGAIDYDSFDVDIVNATRDKLTELRTLGLFGEKRKTESNGQSFGASNKAGDYFGYDSPSELLKKDPKLYEEYAKSKGYR